MRRGILSEWQQDLGAVALILIVVSILANIVARFVFNSPFTWTNELASILIIWSVYFAFGTTYRDKAQLSVTVFADWLPAHIRRVLDAATDGLLAVTLIALAVNAAIAMRMNYGMTTMALDVSVSLAYYLAVALGSASMLYYIARKYLWDPGKGDRP